MTATIYARVDAELKAATDEYAAARGLSLASAVSDLLSRGLEASQNEQSVGHLEQEVRGLRGELMRVRDAASTLDGRLHQRLGQCECAEDLTGYDVLVNCRCPKCARGVTGLFAAPPADSGLDRNEFAPFLAGIGVSIALIVLAYAATNE